MLDDTDKTETPAPLQSFFLVRGKRVDVSRVGIRNAWSRDPGCGSLWGPLTNEAMYVRVPTQRQPFEREDVEEIPPPKR